MKLHRWDLTLWIGLLLIGATVPAFSQSERHDGNWWQEQDRATKLKYTVGFLDGIPLGRSFAYWRFFRAQSATEESVASKIDASYDEYSAKYLNDITNDQIVDGLDSFYSDFRNRRIHTSMAVWLVLQEVAGVPEAEMDKRIESFRGDAK